MQGESKVEYQPRFTTPLSPPANRRMSHVPPVPMLPLSAHGRAMSAPVLALATSKNSKENTPQIVIDRSSEQLEGDDSNNLDLSPVNSICRSPCWSDHGGKEKEKMKKELKKALKLAKKEKEKADKDAKATEKKNKHLSILPAANKRLTKINPVTRAVSDTAVPTLSVSAKPQASPEIRKTKRLSFQPMKDVPAAVSDPLIAQKIDGNKSFIGGLKLALANGGKGPKPNEKPGEPMLAQTTELSRRMSIESAVSDDGIVGQVYHAQLNNSQIFKNFMSSNFREEIEGNEAATPHQNTPDFHPESFAKRMVREGSHILEAGKELPEKELPVRSHRERDTGRPSYHSLVQPKSGESVRDEKIQAALKADVSEFKNARSRSISPPPPAPAVSLDRENAEVEDTSYVKRQRRQSRDMAMRIMQDERLFHRSDDENNRRNESVETDAQGVSRTNEADMEKMEREHNAEMDDYHGFLVRSSRKKGQDKKGKASPEQATVVPSSLKNSDVETPRVGSMERIRGFRNSVFSRQYSPTSPDHLTPPTSSGSNKESTLSDSFLSKADRILGMRTSDSDLKGKGAFRNSRSSSLETDSSEEVWHKGESSDLTTPAVSRPQSFDEKDEAVAVSPKDKRWGSTSTVDPSSQPTSPTAFSQKSKGKLPEGQPKLDRSFSTPQLTDLSFLPPLKHQSLARKKPSNTPPVPNSIVKSNPLGSEDEGASVIPKSGQHLAEARAKVPRSVSKPIIDPRRKSASAPVGPVKGQAPESIGKMFTICCSCKYWHDLPSKLFNAMVEPKGEIIEDKDLGISGNLTTLVECPWCHHGMSNLCCSTHAAVVHFVNNF
jgi:hypothetical protein